MKLPSRPRFGNFSDSRIIDRAIEHAAPDQAPAVVRHALHDLAAPRVGTPDVRHRRGMSRSQYNRNCPVATGGRRIRRGSATAPSARHCATGRTYWRRRSRATPRVARQAGADGRFRAGASKSSTCGSSKSLTCGCRSKSAAALSRYASKPTTSWASTRNALKLPLSPSCTRAQEPETSKSSKLGRISQEHRAERRHRLGVRIVRGVVNLGESRLRDVVAIAEMNVVVVEIPARRAYRAK